MLAIDMINLDHTYLCNSEDSVFNDNKRCRGNIRPIINNNFVDITDNFNRELISQHINNSRYSFESLLSVYVNKYIEEVGDVNKVIFTIPHFFNQKSLKAINHDYTTVNDYIAAASYLYDYNDKINSNQEFPQNKIYMYTLIVPSEYETTIASVDNISHTITNIHTIPYGSYYIKQSIKNALPFDITLDGAWNIYKNLQMINKVNISDIILSIEKSYYMTYDDLTQILTNYYNEITKHIPANTLLAPFRWIARDKTIQHIYKNIIKTYNPDEAICIGAYKYLKNNLYFKYDDNIVYIDNSSINYDDYTDLCEHITMTNMFKDFANKVDEFLIDTRQDCSIEFTKKSLHNILKLIEQSEWKYHNQKKYRIIKNILIKLYKYL